MDKIILLCVIFTFRESCFQVREIIHFFTLQ